MELSPIFYTFNAGHRLQVQIASEDIEYNNIQRQIDVLLLPWPVENTIYHDVGHTSHLILPVIPDAPEIRSVKPPLSEINWPMVPGNWMPNTNGWPLREMNSRKSGHWALLDRGPPAARVSVPNYSAFPVYYHLDIKKT
jgi:hypothetical protein